MDIFKFLRPDDDGEDIKTATGATLSAADIKAAAASLSAAQSLRGNGCFSYPCNDHRPRHYLDEETGWVIIECDTCRMRMHLHPETYTDLMIANEIDEIGEEIKSKGKAKGSQA